MIGHLQRNKVKYIVDKVDMIHSVDSYASCTRLLRQKLLRKMLLYVRAHRSKCSRRRKQIWPENGRGTCLL